MVDPRREPPRGGGPRGGAKQNRWQADSTEVYQSVGAEAGSLFDEPAEPVPFVRTSATSRAAAEVVTPKRATLAAKIFGDFQRYGPATDDQGSQRTGIPLNSYRPRRGDLVKRGLVVAAGVGTSFSGNRAVIWKVADRPPVQEHAPRTTERAEVERPASSAPTADLWAAAVRDRPYWMSKRQHEDEMAKAYKANNGNVKAALEQVARSMERYR